MAPESFCRSVERVGELELAFNLAISSPIFESSFCREASASLIALASFWRRSRSLAGDCSRSFWGECLPGLLVGRDAEGPRPRRVGMLDESDAVFWWLFAPPDQRSLTTIVSGVDMMFCGRSVRLPIFLGAEEFNGKFSF